MTTAPQQPDPPKAATPALRKPLVRMIGVSKRFGPAQVLSKVDFEVLPGEVHVLAGENGAGKSTLIKILAGVITEFEGRVEISGRDVRPQSPLVAARLGIAVIHQELSLVGPMSVADNLFLGRHPVRGGFVSRRRQRTAARRSLSRLGLDIDVDAPVEQFSIAVQQLIEIAKALSLDAHTIVMDEPTSALNAAEAKALFELIDGMRRQGCGIVYISHKMEEIELLADRITVLRDGRNVGVAPAAELPTAQLIQLMVGREMASRSAREPPRRAATPRLKIRDFSVRGLGHGAAPVTGANLEVFPGEVVGLGGLQGSGASELLMAIFGGYPRRTSGLLELDGKAVTIKSPRQALDAGVALVTNDRKETGLVLTLPIIANACLADMPHLSPYGWRQPRRERAAAADAAASFRIAARSLDMLVNELSGGNQQKVALAKCLQTRPRLLLLDEPTRGIDIGAKQEIYALINRWTSQGMAILLITSEMSELLELSDRIYVMHRGRISDELSRGEACPELVLSAAMGTGVNAAASRAG